MCCFKINSVLSRKKVKPRPRERHAIVSRHGNLPVSDNTHFGETLTLTNSISQKELSRVQVHQNRAHAALKNKIAAVLTFGPRFKSASQPRVASHGLKLSHYAGVYHHRPTTWSVRRDWRPQS